MISNQPFLGSNLGLKKKKKLLLISANQHLNMIKCALQLKVHLIIANKIHLRTCSLENEALGTVLEELEVYSRTTPYLT